MIRYGFLLTAVGALAGCARADIPRVASPPPVNDAYVEPARVDLGRQEYGPGHQRFPPIVTARTGYPTQEQAAAALRRSRWGTETVKTLVTKDGVRTLSIPASPPDITADGIRLFACRPGALDGITSRVETATGPVVVCASDLLGSRGQTLARLPLNFYYANQAWHIEDPKPGYSMPPWAIYEPSPPGSWSPFGDRY